MQFRRGQFNGTISPLRELYGQADGFLLFPLDFCIMQDVAGVETLVLPGVNGVFDNAPVVGAGGGATGTIHPPYDWPPANMFDVNPIVRVGAADGVDMSGVPTGRDPQPIVQVGDAVQIETIAADLSSQPGGITGTVGDLVGPKPYPDFGHRVSAYRVDFGSNLFGPSHGSRVTLAATGELLGMVLATQNQDDGSCHALVFPAHLV